MTTAQTPPPGPPGPRRHRADRLHTAAAAAIAVMVILIGILLVDLVHDPSSHTTAAGANGQPSAGTGTATPSQAPLPGIGPDGEVTTTPPAHRSPTASPKPSPKPKPSSTSARPGSGATTAKPVLAQVAVYNNSKIEGQADAAAARLRAAGYNVVKTGSVFGLWPTTTVYYDPPDKAAAEWMAAHVEGVRQAKPRPSYLARTGTLILVVTKDFPTDATQ
jgi:hypothetical protein